MIELATLYRTLNIYTHHAHNMTKGDTFFEDHSFFAGLYETADDYYDQIIERMIGTGSSSIDIASIMSEATHLIANTNGAFFETSLVLLNEILDTLEKVSKSGKISVGTQNLLQGQADALEVIVYKVKQKLK